MSINTHSMCRTRSRPGIGYSIFEFGEHIYHGLVSDGAAEPRAGFAYKIKRTGTVLRGAYARTFETPYNENLLLSNATGLGGLATSVFGASSAAALSPGRRNQFNMGFQQSI